MWLLVFGLGTGGEFRSITHCGGGGGRGGYWFCDMAGYCERCCMLVGTTSTRSVVASDCKMIRRKISAP